MTFLTIVTLAALSAGGADGGRAVRLKDVGLKGEIEGENITFELSFTAEARKRNPEVALVSGDLVLDELVEPKKGCSLRYDPKSCTYYASWGRAGTRKVRVRFACRPRVLEDAHRREAVFTIPASNVRKLELVCDRTDLEVAFPGAMRVERELKEGTLVVTALLGPAHPFAVRWKPQVQELEAKLVMACDANTIVSAETGALRVDSAFIFDISQGLLRGLSFSVPEALSVTQVRGDSIRDWHMEDGAEGRTLSVTLTRPRTRRYALQVESEMVLAGFPAEVEFASVEPKGVIRAGGHVIVGTDSRVRLTVRESGGLSQTDPPAFPRIVLHRDHPRPVPTSTAFSYAYATSPFRMKLFLDDIVPSFDASQRVVIEVREDDLVVDAEIELDVRDAPIRALRVGVDRAFAVADVTGAQVEDYAVRDNESREIEVQFRRPVLGRTLVRVRLELGETTLGKPRRVGSIAVRGAKNERGYVVVAAERGVELDTPAGEKLREVHTGSVPMRVPGAQFAYRFREGGWSIRLAPRKKPPAIRAEAFHLVSLGEGVVYGSVVVTYFVSGAPVDGLTFRIPAALRNVEFVGRDVRRWSRDGEDWEVELQRKVIGDYTLLVSYNQHYRAGGTVLVGGVECAGLDTQTGYIVVASHLSLELAPEEEPDASLLQVDRDELPPAYGLLVSAPLLKAYKYVNAPHRVSVELTPHARGRLLPAVVDMTEIETRVSLRKGRAESVTRVEYRIKNSASQFLALSMPPEARVWSAHVIARDAEGGETRARAAVSYDGERGMLMIPLARRRDPNDPVTVELEYAQSHGQLGWRGEMDLQAPRGDIRSTFARWEVRVPAGRVVRPEEGGSMLPDGRAFERGGLAGLGTHVFRSWSWSFGRLWRHRVPIWLCLAGVVGVGLVLVFRRGVLTDAVLGAGLLVAVLAGVCAARSPFLGGRTKPPEALSSLTFTRALNLEEEAPPSVSVRVVPAWRRHATLFGSIVLPPLALAALAIAVLTRRGRPALLAFGATGLTFAAAQFPALWPALGHLFTWGVPVALTLVFARRLAAGLSIRLRGAQAAALLLLGVFLWTGCARDSEVIAAPVLDRVDCNLRAEKDSMEVELRLRLDAPGPLSFPVMPQSAILLEPQEESKHFSVSGPGGGYRVRVNKRGAHALRLRFLAPLEEARKDRPRSFRLAIPPALTNRVTLELPEPGMDVESPTAVRLTAEETETTTVARAIFGPGDDAAFVWKPRARRPGLEKTVFFAEVTSLVRFDAGLAECRHRVLFQVAQGELKLIGVRIPEGMTVTGVEGEELGAWRFDPFSRELEAHLARPASGEYELAVSTQIPVEGLPCTVTVLAPEALGAGRQRGSVGIATGPAVFVELEEHPAVMNVDDFVRDASRLFGSSPSDVRHAFRYHRLDEGLRVKVREVRPELRTRETASFTVTDDRLVYNGEFVLKVAKAGVFSAELILPEGYDIDTLGAPEVSHWDEGAAGAARTVTVHFRKKVLGEVTLKLALSRAAAELPREIAVPGVRAPGAIKHTGRVVISSGRGVRLSAAGREGVSELSPAELGIRAKGILAFRLLRPDWTLTLRTEVVETRSVVDFLHLARVTEGLVRHTAHLGFRLYNAGSKLFQVRVPASALGLEIDGPEIAHLEESPQEPGLWRVELASKWFGRPYPLTVRYETRFDRASGEVRLSLVKAPGVDLQRGHVVVYATEKVELTPVSVDPSLRPADARSIPRRFGADDLSAAAFCWASSSADCELVLRAARHEAAALLEAEVRGLTVTTVATERGESMNRVEMDLLVGGKRHLRTRLPRGAELWSLLVNGRSVAPSRRDGHAAGPILVPLGQAAPGEVPVRVELIYAAPALEDGARERRSFAGPSFDLPLKNVEWAFYLPEGFVYDGFDGTLAVDGEALLRGPPRRFGPEAYEAELRRLRAEDERRALELLKQGDVLARRGEQREARRALESACSLSLSQRDLNEDARVQLHRLSREQVLVGLVGRRARLRPRFGGAGELVRRRFDLGDRFSREEAERLRNSLGKADSENLQLIADRITEQQEAAADFVWPLHVAMARRGRTVRFARALQVEPDSEMSVSFRARRTADGRDASRLWAAGLFLLLSLALACARFASAKWPSLGGSPATP